MKAQKQTQAGKKQNGLTEAAWNFAYTALWNGTSFSTKEISEAKTSINRFFDLSQNPRKAFISFCQRITLVKTYLETRQGSYLPLPSQWFDPQYPHGFTGTRSWLQKVEARRSAIPQHRIQLKALAEAVLEFHEAPTTANYRYWTAYFGEHGHRDLLNLFMTNVANSQFN